jgi:hypothetical protein
MASVITVLLISGSCTEWAVDNMRLDLILAGLGAFWPIQGLAYSANARHQDTGPVPVSCSDGLVDQVPPEVSPLRPRQDIDVKAAAKAAIDAMNSKFYLPS